MSPWELAVVALAGVAAGFINTVAGSGTLVTVPTLLAFGVPPVTANVSNTIGLVPGSVSGVVGYRRELEGQRQASILKAEGDAQAAVLRADGEAQAIQKVFDAIHAGNPDQKLLAYQYLQTLPKIAQGDANKVWIVPSELGEALKGIGGMLGTSEQRPPVPPA